jgi:23S rRNA (guanine745-N1)-methyltransferase
LLQVFDAILSVFAPCPLLEVSRVLCKGGVLVVVKPGRDHLKSIKALIYDNPKPFTEQLCVESDLQQAGLALKAVERVRYEVHLHGEDASNLLSMTPYLWRADKNLQISLQAMDEVHTTVDVLVAVYQPMQI